MLQSQLLRLMPKYWSCSRPSRRCRSLWMHRPWTLHLLRSLRNWILPWQKPDLPWQCSPCRKVVSRCKKRSVYFCHCFADVRKPLQAGDSFASRWASCSTFYALPWAVQSVAASSVVPTWSGHLEPTPEYPPGGLRCVFRKQQAFSADICLSLCGSSLESWVGNEENINKLQSHTIQ